MKKVINDGGPIASNIEKKELIQPNLYLINTSKAIGGLSVRDWFAGMAMQSRLASYDSESIHPCSNELENKLAQISYQIADAMLAARKAPSGLEG